MNSTSKNTIKAVKDCAGKGCSELGIHYLKIRFIKRSGWFCESCKRSLIDDNLVTTTIDPGVASISDNNS